MELNRIGTTIVVIKKRCIFKGMRLPARGAQKASLKIGFY
jgi:hypothetical protein